MEALVQELTERHKPTINSAQDMRKTFDALNELIEKLVSARHGFDTIYTRERIVLEKAAEAAYGRLAQMVTPQTDMMVLLQCIVALRTKLEGLAEPNPGGLLAIRQLLRLPRYAPLVVIVDDVWRGGMLREPVSLVWAADDEAHVAHWEVCLRYGLGREARFPLEPILEGQSPIDDTIILSEEAVQDLLEQTAAGRQWASDVDEIIQAVTDANLSASLRDILRPRS